MEITKKMPFEELKFIQKEFRPFQKQICHIFKKTGFTKLTTKGEKKKNGGQLHNFNFISSFCLLSRDLEFTKLFSHI